MVYDIVLIFDCFIMYLFFYYCFHRTNIQFKNLHDILHDFQLPWVTEIRLYAALKRLRTNPQLAGVFPICQVMKDNSSE